MRYEGEIFELDREEFNSLRKKLSRVLDALVEESSDIKREGLAEIPLWNSDDSITSEAVDEMLKLLEESKDVDDFINQI